MILRIRKMMEGTSNSDLVLEVMKSTTIAELHEIILEKLKVKTELQRLYYRGKQLVPEHSIGDYQVQLDNVIQLVVINNTRSTELEKKNSNKEDSVELKAESCFYKVGDQIDVLDDDEGCWFEATILQIFRRRKDAILESDLTFRIQLDRNMKTYPLDVGFFEIRPRAFYNYQQEELKIGMQVFVNYNLEDNSMRGYWYDLKITKINNNGLEGNLIFGVSKATIENCIINNREKIMRIEKPTLVDQRKRALATPLRALPINCAKCRDIFTRKCKKCCCKICGVKSDTNYLLTCDDCYQSYHLQCLNPSVTYVPSDSYWYCPKCKTNTDEIIKPGEGLKVNKKSKKQQQWGKGMACVGRTKVCNIVPKRHFGAVPGIDVGTRWRFRMQVAEAGIHRPHVAGIHGCETEGAYSLALSGGYEDDVDNGNEFFYSGSGGRNLEGTRLRVGAQTHDQTLTKNNKALALNCDCDFNDVSGGNARNWRKGKPVRVVRSHKLKKRSKFAPNGGIRYDGIYKVVKYFPQTGKSGFVVWRFLLRRDDPVAAPWESGAVEFSVIEPIGTSAKRIREVDEEDSINTSKISKTKAFQLSDELSKIIKSDKTNKIAWQDCQSVMSQGKLKYFEKILEVFMCVCCQELVNEPVSIVCRHNVCKSCLERSFLSEIFACPVCRLELKENYVIEVNMNLSMALKMLFPEYNTQR